MPVLVYLLLAVACLHSENNTVRIKEETLDKAPSSMQKDRSKDGKSSEKTELSDRKKNNKSKDDELREETEEPFDEGTDIYDYKGKAPFNIAGNVEVLSTHLFSDQLQTQWSKDDKGNWNSKNLEEKTKKPFDNLKLSVAKLGITLQKVKDNTKMGTMFSITAKPGKIEVSQANLYLKHYFDKARMKCSARIGCTYGADRKLALLSDRIVRRTTNLYTMSDDVVIPNVVTSSRLATNTGTSIKGVVKAKKFLMDKKNNIVVSASYTPEHPHKGVKSFAKIDDKHKIDDCTMRNHLGLGLKWHAKKGDFNNCVYATFAYAKRYEMESAKMNDVKGLIIGNNAEYKSIRFGLSYGIIMDKKIKSYSESFEDKIKNVNFDNQRHDDANGGYIISPAVAFTVPSGPMKNLELYAVYMHSDRKTEWQDGAGSKIHAKSDIVSVGFAVPWKQFVFGTKVEVMKFNNKAHKDEQLINSYLTNEKEFKTLNENNKWRTAVSLFFRVKVSHNVDVSS